MPDHFAEAIVTLFGAIKTAERKAKETSNPDWGYWDDMLYRLRVIHRRLMAGQGKDAA